MTATTSPPTMASNGRPLPPKIDPLTRVRAYRELAETVEQQRQKLLGEGKPVFLIGGHYGTVGQLSLYIPEARTNVASNPLVYFLTTRHALNQFYFWPSYKDNRTGQNAIYVKELSSPPLVRGWIPRWLKGEPMESLVRVEPEAKSPPDVLLREFDSVNDLGLYNIYYRGRIFHTIQLFECRNLH